MTTTITFSAALTEFAEAFETRTRNDGGEFTCLKDDCPDWIDTDTIHDIHSALDDRMPDDWVYETAASFADTLSGYTCEDADDARGNVHEIADGMVDVYHADRLKWLAANLNNAFLVDDACEEFGSSDADTFQRIGLGQFMAIRRIGDAVIAAIENHVEE